MRVARTFMLCSAVAIAVAGCAQRPVAYMPLGGAPGIDNTIYGQPAAYPLTTGSIAPQTYVTAPPAPTYAAQPGYAPPAAAGYAAPAPTYPGYAAPGYATPGYATPGYATPSYAAPGYAVAPGARVVAAPAAYVPLAQDGPYTLDSGDRLRVVVFGQDGLTNSYAVDASGCIAMPLIGSVQTRGLTTDQLSGHIADQLRQGFIREPHVAVEIEAYRPFFILGEVTQPGQYPYVANMTVETAVAIAGGFGPRGVRNHVVISRNLGGRIVRFQAPVTYPVRPGDTVIAQERWF